MKLVLLANTEPTSKSQSVGYIKISKNFTTEKRWSHLMNFATYSVCSHSTWSRSWIGSKQFSTFVTF